MKNLSDRNKRWITIAGLGAVCIVLVIAISSQFKTKTPIDDVIVPSSEITDEANPSPESGTTVMSGEKEVKVRPVEQAISTEAPNTAVSDSTEQTIKPEPVKPKAPPEAPKPQGDIKNPSKPPEYKPEDTVVTELTEPKAGDTKDGKVYFPGFGWIDDNGGGSKGTVVDGKGDINKQVGEMD